MSDLISRQAAIDALKKISFSHWFECGEYLSEDTREIEIINSNKALEAIEALPSAQQWIPVTEGLPEDLEEVNVTWVNHEPEPYYSFVKDKPFTATAVYYKEKWYWYSSTCADFLAEYGRNPSEEIDDSIEIIAWMPLPEPWKGEDDDN